MRHTHHAIWIVGCFALMCSVGTAARPSDTTPQQHAPSPRVVSPAAGSSTAGSSTGGIVSAPTLAIRISGLVCDLCVHGVERDLKALSGVVDAVVLPREGVVALTVVGQGPTTQSVRAVLLAAGYTVHAVSPSSVSTRQWAKNPSVYVAQLWRDGAREQKKVLATPQAQANVCAQRKNTSSFGAYDATTWGASNTSKTAHL